MIVEIHAVKCDICAKLVQAKAVRGRYNETEYDLPDGWKYHLDRDLTLCPDCFDVLTKAGRIAPSK